MSVPYRLKTAGLTINLRQEDTGPPLLFLRGSNVDLSIKSPVFDSALPEYFTVVAPALVPWSHEVHGTSAGATCRLPAASGVQEA